MNQAAYQLGSALGQALVNWLFRGNSNPQAAAERQAFLRDLEQRRLEAKRQHRLAEAQRIQAMQDRLYATLKLNGLQELHLKDIEDRTPGSGLKLKTREDAQRGYGINGLPGIYVGGPKDGASAGALSGTAREGSAGSGDSENAGAAGEQGKGIPGLPGIYVNGPREERFSLGGDSSAMNAAQSGLQRKAAIVGKDGQPEFEKMPAQEIAALREQVASLPPEELDRMISATQAGKAGGASVANEGDAPPPVFKPSPQAQAAQAGSEQAAMPNQSAALTQLQQQASALASAPGTNSPEALSAGARSGFDTPMNGGTLGSAIPAAAAVPSRSPQEIEQAIPTISSGALHTKAPPKRGPAPTEPGAASAPAATAATPLSPQPPVVDLSKNDVPLVAHPSDLKIPSRDGHPLFATPQERLAEVRREVVVLRQVLVKLSQAQMDPAERKEWEDTINKASGDAAYQAGILAVDVFNYFTLKRFRAKLEDTQKSLEDAAVKLAGETADANHREQLGAAIRLMEKQKAELGVIVENMDGVTHNGDNFVAALQTYDWLKKNDYTPEHDLEGLHLSMQMALDNKLVQKWAGVSGEFGDALKFGTHASDATYDATSVLLGAARLREMNRQSQQYYDRVNELSTRMKQAVDEMKSLEQQIQK